VGQESSLAIGSDGLAVIGHWDFTNVRLRITRCSNAECTEATTSTIENNRQEGNHLSLTIGTDGFPIASLVDVNFSSLWVAHCLDASCATSETNPVDATGSSSTMIIIDTDDRPLIVASTGSRLRVTRCNNSTCTA
jgi:hypothetical protein